jgi:hypothetical protein
LFPRLRGAISAALSICGVPIPTEQLNIRKRALRFAKLSHAALRHGEIRAHSSNPSTAD